MSHFQEKMNVDLQKPPEFIKSNENCPNKDEYLVFETAIFIENEGNAEFQTGNYQKALELYNEAITLLLSLDMSKCSGDLVIFYHNRAATHGFLNKITLMIEDATKAIAVDRTYAKGYYLRACGQNIQKKTYCALQDIVWACIYDRFRNEAYNRMAAEISAQHAKIPIDRNVELALGESRYGTGGSEWRKRQTLIRLRESTLLDDIAIPIDYNATAKGYFRAIKGLIDLNEAETLAGCAEEISAKGQYWIECQIIHGYVTNLCVMHINVNYSEKYLKIFMELIDDRKTTQNLRNNLLLCYANLRMSFFLQYSYFRDFQQANTEYKLINRLLTDMESKNQIERHKIYVIKSGVLRFAFALSKRLYGESSSIAALFKSDLLTCCRLMPNFFYIQKETLLFCQMPCRSIASLRKLKKLCDRFPNKIELQGLYITQLGREVNRKSEAIQELNTLRLSYPHLIDETWGIEGVLHEGQPISVQLFERAIDNNPYDGLYYLKLAEYFGTVSHEYGKALEVLNHGLELDTRKIREMFELRQNLLTKVVAENCWEKL